MYVDKCLIIIKEMHYNDYFKVLSVIIQYRLSSLNEGANFLVTCLKSSWEIWVKIMKNISRL